MGETVGTSRGKGPEMFHTLPGSRPSLDAQQESDRIPDCGKVIGAGPVLAGLALVSPPGCSP